MVRVAFFGSPEAAVPSLRALLASRHDVAVVVTKPDKPAGRGRSVIATPIRRLAEEARIPLLLPVRVRDPAFLEQISGVAPDVFAVTAYGQILPPGLLALPRFGSLNVHFSLLPKYRGRAPLNWVLVNGEPVSAGRRAASPQGIVRPGTYLSIERRLASSNALNRFIATHG